MYNMPFFHLSRKTSRKQPLKNPNEIHKFTNLPINLAEEEMKRKIRRKEKNLYLLLTYNHRKLGID